MEKEIRKFIRVYSIRRPSKELFKNPRSEVFEGFWIFVFSSKFYVYGRWLLFYEKYEDTISAKVSLNQPFGYDHICTYYLVLFKFLVLLSDY
jgi:hypothetical protein